MGEKLTKVTYGCSKEDVPESDKIPDGLYEWASRRPAKKTIKGRYGAPAFGGLELDTSYESDPEWLGFSVKTCEYSETCEPFDRDVKLLHKAKAAWSILAETVFHELGLTLPQGRLIIAMDE